MGRFGEDKWGGVGRRQVLVYRGDKGRDENKAGDYIAGCRMQDTPGFLS